MPINLYIRSLCLELSDWKDRNLTLSAITQIRAESHCRGEERRPTPMGLTNSTITPAGNNIPGRTPAGLSEIEADETYQEILMSSLPEQRGESVKAGDQRTGKDGSDVGRQGAGSMSQQNDQGNAR